MRREHDGNMHKRISRRRRRRRRTITAFILKSIKFFTSAAISRSRIIPSFRTTSTSESLYFCVEEIKISAVIRSAKLRQTIFTDFKSVIKDGNGEQNIFPVQLTFLISFILVNCLPNSHRSTPNLRAQLRTLRGGRSR